MGRSIGAVVAAFLLWTVLWLAFGAGAQVLMPELVAAGQPVTHTGVLLAYLVWSVLISALAGYVCAAVKRERPLKTVWIFALILLFVGIGVEASAWALTPVWYHLVFLTLLVPAAVWGGGVRTRTADPVTVAAQ
ncbi:MAG TPA: hypothetical protein VMM35_03720 [Longimicrobiales bacterium]|nr:hypothetical protein [Longimicrobiales bacterium]